LAFDAYHLQGMYKGVLLTVMGLDENNGFPLTYAVVGKKG